MPICYPNSNNKNSIVYKKYYFIDLFEIELFVYILKKFLGKSFTKMSIGKFQFVSMLIFVEH